MTDPIDEFAIPQLREYKGKALKAADRDELPEAVKPEGYVPDEAPFRGLFDSLASVLDGVKEIRLSRRLRESAACLVAPEGEMGANMERILKRSGHAAEVGESKRVLKLNGGHPAVEALRSLHRESAGRSASRRIRTVALRRGCSGRGFEGQGPPGCDGEADQRTSREGRGAVSPGSPFLDRVATRSYFVGVRAVGIKALKDHLSEYVRLAEGGETVLVTDRDRVVAELGPVRAGRSEILDDAFLAEAVRQGWFTPPTVRDDLPARSPVAPLAEVLHELEADREDL